MRISMNIYVTNEKYKPVYKTEGSVAMDLKARVPEGSYTLKPGELHKFDTGVHIELPESFAGLMRPRSGLSMFDVDVKPGTIDFDYRGEIGIMIKNNSLNNFLIQDGDRIAQLVIVEAVIAYDIHYVDSLDKLSATKRGSRGFGHTGLR